MIFLRECLSWVLLRFEGNELVIPPSAFGTFNDLMYAGEINPGPP